LWRRKGLPIAAPLRIYLIVALIGTIFPDWPICEAARHLPAGLCDSDQRSRMFGFPIALVLKIDHFSLVRPAGIYFRFGGRLVVCWARSQASPDAAMLVVFICRWSPVFFMVSRATFSPNGHLIVIRFGDC
jgi:hypothetical protein